MVFDGHEKIAETLSKEGENGWMTGVLVSGNTPPEPANLILCYTMDNEFREQQVDLASEKLRARFGSAVLRDPAMS